MKAMKHSGAVLFVALASACGGGDGAAPGIGGGGTSGGGGSGSGSGGSGGGGPLPDDPTSGLTERPTNETCVAPARPTSVASIELERVFPKLLLHSTTGLEQAPGDGSRWWASQQPGRIVVFDATPEVFEATVALDITGRVSDGGELGLLGLALAPDFATSGHVYVSYTASGPVSRISRFTSNDGGATFDANSEQILFTLNQPHDNHNGGDLQFGPDGMLYIGYGDGGSGGDPDGNGQNPHTPLGTILRIDVSGGGNTYAIPPDNPFADGQDGHPAVWAYGLRNPWRLRFDRESGELWTGDVGQDAFEEVDRIVKGGNYGWNTKEGSHCFKQDPCDLPDLIDPVVEYAHGDSALSVVGGYVYRGSAIPELRGVYLFADFYTPGPISGVFYDSETHEAEARQLGELGELIGTFAQDVDGEIYVADFYGGIYKIVAAEMGPPAPTFPQKLSETGCFDATDPTRPVDALIPYDVNQPLWSDGASKSRWVALPDGTSATTASDGDLDFPNGTVLAKEFRLDNQRLETRLFVRHQDGGWAGYAYQWLSDESDAVLVPNGAQMETASGTWKIPSESDCLRCHTSAAGGALGPELAQLNLSREYAATGRTANQLTTWHHIGLLADDPGSPAEAPRLANGESDSLEDRARSYLHANCSNCHRPDATPQTKLDLRWSTSFADSLTCGIGPTRSNLGVSGSRLIAPGSPEESIIPLRMRSLGEERMPDIGSDVVDEGAVGMIEEWITSLESCPDP
jgi:uncharacterized repeat protein (TIGR03806 family)